MTTYAAISPGDNEPLGAVVAEKFPDAWFKIGLGQDIGPPLESAVGAPVRDLHPTMDARFVLTEVSKLSALVERLIADVKEQGSQIDALRHQVTWFKGGVAILGTLIVIIPVLIALVQHITFH